MKKLNFLSRSLASTVLILLFFADTSLLFAAESQGTRPLLHPLFSDHAVLQRGIRVPVWGWTEPGTQVTVTFAGQEHRAVADSTGRWQVRLRSLRASNEPRELTVSTASGARQVIKDVLVGDVWLCSGQSNMEMGIGLCNATNDVVTANFPRLRLLTVPKRIAVEPRQLISSEWKECTPDTVMRGGWGGFSATAFYFGRELHRTLNIPIGLIHSSWGGTVAEAWTSEEGLEPLDDFDEKLRWVREMAGQGTNMNYDVAFERWCQGRDAGTQQGWQNSAEQTDGWKVFEMPRSFEQTGMDQFDGIVWYRREFELTEADAGREFRLELGALDDYDTTWINGTVVGRTYRPDHQRRYRIPAGVLRAGRNVVAVRVLDTGGLGGFTGRPEQVRLVREGGDAVSLAGPWQVRQTVRYSGSDAPPPSMESQNPNFPTFLYNAMIAPLVPYGIKGAIWYQGEANADRAAQYRRLLPAMIGDWRKRFGVGTFPFYIVQLAAWRPTHPEPRNHPWAELREAQALTAERDPNSGLAVAIDIGDADDIHPKDKRSVGHRLALNALARTYGYDIEYSGPTFRSLKISGNEVRVTFDHAKGGLKVRGDELKGFALAGEDGKFVWAQGRVDGNAVVLSAPGVSRPVAVRYAWDINPVCNLFNEQGLPAVPFRTDRDFR